MSTIFQVTVASAGNATIGFIDNIKVQNRTDDLSTLSEDQCLAARQSNFRWERILSEMAMVANPYIIAVEAVGADAGVLATEFKFAVSFINDAVLQVTYEDEILTGADALKQMVAGALVGPATKHCTVPDPVIQDGTGEFILDLEVVELVADLDAALALVTVEEIELLA